MQAPRQVEAPGHYCGAKWHPEMAPCGEGCCNWGETSDLAVCLTYGSHLNGGTYRGMGLRYAVDPCHATLTNTANGKQLTSPTLTLRHTGPRVHCQFRSSGTEYTVLLPEQEHKRSTAPTNRHAPVQPWIVQALASWWPSENTTAQAATAAKLHLPLSPAAACRRPLTHSC
jgi:hypothetical protein